MVYYDYHMILRIRLGLCLITWLIQTVDYQHQQHFQPGTWRLQESTRLSMIIKCYWCYRCYQETSFDTLFAELENFQDLGP